VIVNRQALADEGGIKYRCRELQFTIANSEDWFPAKVISLKIEHQTGCINGESDGRMASDHHGDHPRRPPPVRALERLLGDSNLRRIAGEPKREE
jgi:hypothetical protein